MIAPSLVASAPSFSSSATTATAIAIGPHPRPRPLVPDDSRRRPFRGRQRRGRAATAALAQHGCVDERLAWRLHHPACASMEADGRVDDSRPAEATGRDVSAVRRQIECGVRLVQWLRAEAVARLDLTPSRERFMVPGTHVFSLMLRLRRSLRSYRHRESDSWHGLASAIRSQPRNRDVRTLAQVSTETPRHAYQGCFKHDTAPSAPLQMVPAFISHFR
jgi:hypothetical protein